MLRPLKVEPRPGYRLYVEYSDGIKGEVDLSYLTGRGVFSAWDGPRFFNQVRIGPSQQIAWDDDMELCADALYLKLTGLQPEDIFPALA